MEWTIMLKRFGDTIGIDNLTADEDDSVLMYSRVGSVSKLDKDECLMLLKASLLGAQTGGGALSAEDDTDAVVLWKRFDDTISDDVLKVVLNGFLGQVAAWKQKLAHDGIAQERAGVSQSTPAGADAFSHIGNFA